MRKLLLSALIALSIVSCTSNDSEITSPEPTYKAEGVLSFTYSGTQETIYNAAIFDDKGLMLPSFKNDLSKPWFSWKQNDAGYSVYLGFGRNMEDPRTPQRRMFKFCIKKPNRNTTEDFNYYINGTAVPLINKKITITSVDSKYISGTFSSDKITGKFQNIRYNTIF